MEELYFALYKSLSRRKEAVKFWRVYVETWQRMDSQLLLQWLAIILKSEVNDTKKGWRNRRSSAQG